ncbi:Mu homology domain-containing protein [Mycotypha africana]|uniref:adaptor complex AP-3 domain-containing protein n=1 Tax=Mycotypha africana TaxID=64632 RepID=UPI0022FFE8B7|nr:adaptor complex AP-3 domain-containing protein [Mycotypha africana]KAI8977042.1 Mu homology domain-containing protein [Mycotypha africana]
MINSLFVINKQGKIIIEKHWRGIISRQIVDVFNDECTKFMNSPAGSVDERVNASIPLKGETYFTREDVPPVLETNKYWLLNVLRNDLTWLCPVEREVDPMLIFEFIHRIMDILTDYLGDVSESSIRENFVTVYQLFEEMMDYGYPLTTEPNALKEIIMPPTIINKVMTSVGAAAGVAPKIPQSMSNIPWRKAGVKYTQNEIYFDIIEEIDATIAANGNVVSCEAHGSVQTNCKLSGMPDLTLSFVNARVIDDVSFHPCVRYRKWESEKVLSFVPPDGQFKLMSYRASLSPYQAMPLQIKPQITSTNNGGRFDIKVQPRSTDGKPIEKVVLTLPMPRATQSVNASCNFGQYMYDPVRKSITWDIGKLSLKDIAPTLSGTFSTNETNPELSGLNVTLGFQINMYAVSGLKVDSLRLFHEAYKPYKGVRSMTKAGKIIIRT